MLATANALLSSMIPTKIDDGCEIIEQLKEKFHASTDKSESDNSYNSSQSWSVQKVLE